MARKTSTTHNGSRGSKSRARRNFELVMPEKMTALIEEQEPEPRSATKSKVHAINGSIATAILEKAEESQVAAAKSKVVSASARLAVRRQAAQKARHRGVGSFMTLEDYSYIKRDLITITILSLVMLTIIIVLYFIIGG